MKKYTLEQIREMKRSATRELAYRRHVYPRQVGRGRMHQPEADRELAAMELIVGLVGQLEEDAAGVQQLLPG
jgi:hypothetical protein